MNWNYVVVKLCAYTLVPVVKMVFTVCGPVFIPLQFDTLPFDAWLRSISIVLNIIYALTIKGYLILILLGFMIFMTGLNDTLAKILITLGGIIYFVGPFVIAVMANNYGVLPPTAESAIFTWNSIFHMSESDFIATLILLGDMLMCIGILAGAILYFVPSSNELRNRGQSLIVRSLMMAPVLAFFHITTLI